MHQRPSGTTSLTLLALRRNLVDMVVAAAILIPRHHRILSVRVRSGSGQLGQNVLHKLARALGVFVRRADAGAQACRGSSVRCVLTGPRGGSSFGVCLPFHTCRSTMRERSLSPGWVWV